jgi:hypothetical protein
MIPMAWLSFNFLGLSSAITGGLIENLEGALGTIGSLLGPVGEVLVLLAGAIIGLFLIFLFPIHWCLFYRPSDVMLLIAVVVPWILCCVITSGLFAHSPRGGLHTSLAIGIGYAIPLVAIYIAIPVVLGGLAPGIGGILTGLIDGLSSGLTDLPFILAVLTAIFEGCLVGALFGAFIGSLKYKPEDAEEKPKKRGKPITYDKEEPSFDTLTTQASTSASTDTFCKNCGMKLVPGDDFCVNCGAKRR